MDIYSYYILQRIEYGHTVHHIVPIKEDWSKRLDVNNLIYLTESNHQAIHQLLEKQGKTTLSLILAAIVSNGWVFTTENKFAATESGNVLYITAEDGLADTIAPRLIKAGANMHKIFSYEETSTEQLSFMNPAFEELIKKAQPRLVIADPIQGYLGKCGWT